MHIVVSVALVISALLPANAFEAEPKETVGLLVKTDQPALLSELRGEIGGRAQGWHRVVVPVEGTVDRTVALAARRLNAPVSVDWQYVLLGPESEPLFGDQWGLENAGQSGGTPDADVDATTAWPVALGTGVVIAVIDSGVDPDNPEIAHRIWTNSEEVPGDSKDNDQNGYVDDVKGWDFKDDDSDPSPDGAGFDDAHATLVAGVLAAEVDGAGITGMAPQVEVMNLRACDKGFCSSFDASIAIYYAVDMGADIINLSFGAPVPENIGDLMMDQAIDYALANDVLVVTAAGNSPPDEVGDDEVILPAEFPHPNNIAVAASDRNDNLADFSYYSSAIDIAAPGKAIVTTDLAGYAQVDGTSFSAPFVAGVAALLLESKPGMGHVELADRLKGFADRPAGIGTKTEAGRLNAGSSLTRNFIDAVGHLFESDIEWAANVGITKGCNPPMNTLFCPGQPVSREVMAAFLNRYLDLGPASKDYFTDDDSSIFEDDINRLAEAGITKGCGPSSFCPKNIVDRGQMAAFLVRAFDLTDDGGGDLFVDDDTSIFEREIDILGTAGITKGCNPPTNDRYCPSLAVDRGAMTAFLHRAPSP